MFSGWYFSLCSEFHKIILFLNFQAIFVHFTQNKTHPFFWSKLCYYLIMGPGLDLSKYWWRDFLWVVGEKRLSARVSWFNWFFKISCYLMLILDSWLLLFCFCCRFCLLLSSSFDQDWFSWITFFLVAFLGSRCCLRGSSCWWRD